MKDYLSRSLRFSEYNISSVSFKEDKKEKPTATFDYELTVNNFATKSGERIFFTPSVTKTEYLQDFPSALKIMESQISSDSISYNLPLGYKVEFVPANVAINSEFGKFRYSLEVKNDKVIYRRYLEMTKGIIPLDQYNDFRSFINSVAKADRQNIILAKGTV